jgi:hypothetical protein
VTSWAKEAAERRKISGRIGNHLSKASPVDRLFEMRKCGLFLGRYHMDKTMDKVVI